MSAGHDHAHDHAHGHGGHAHAHGADREGERWKLAVTIGLTATILVAEDDVEMRRLVADTLRDDGYDVLALLQETFPSEPRHETGGA